MTVAHTFAVPPAADTLGVARTRRVLWVACVLWTLLGYPIALWLPVTAGWENGVLENL